ncbi:MAG: DciA family protein [Pseudomonadota bacterium]
MNRKQGPKQVASLTSKLVDPLLAKRVGMTTALMAAWPEIVGQDIAAQSRPLKIKWPARASDGEFQPGTLIVATNAMAALHLQHETSQIIERVNTFMGYTAITAVKVEQRAVGANQAKSAGPSRPLATSDKAKVIKAVRPVENERLQKALKEMGESVMRERRR